MNAAYAAASVPEPYQILGLRLKPFCLGHFLLMQRFGCAFVNEKENPVTLSDLLLAVAICAHTYEEFLQLIDSEDWLDQIKEWGRQCGLFNVSRKIELFCEYLKKGCEQPEVFFEGQPKDSGAHWTLSLKTALIELGYSPSQAMNLPLSQAFTEFYKAAENRGVVTFAPEGLDEFMEENIPAAAEPAPLPEAAP